MVSIGAATDIGLVRSVNQDCYGVSEKFAVVADGMGGHNCGEIASKIAVDTITDLLSKKKNIDFDVIGFAIKKANDEIFNKSKEDSSMSGMGTTVVLCAWDNDNAYIANVGDSRGYKICGSNITQITKDHSLVQKLLDNGDISPEEASVRKDKNVLYRAVGCDEIPEPDFYELSFQTGDVVLLCSDGLTNCVSNNEILKIVNENQDMQSAADKLIQIANKNGGYDNITVLIIKFM